MTDLTKYATFNWVTNSVECCRQFNSVFGTYEMGDAGAGNAFLIIPGNATKIVRWDDATAMAEEDFYSRDPERFAKALYEEGWEDAEAGVAKGWKQSRVQREIYNAGYDTFNLEVL